MIRRWITTFIFLLSAAVAVRAQQATSKTVVLKAARMFDGKSNSLVTPGLVVVTDGKIAAVGASAAVPAGAQVIDLGDAALLPGFIDAHTHETMMNSNDSSNANWTACKRPSRSERWMRPPMCASH